MNAARGYWGLNQSSEFCLHLSSSNQNKPSVSLFWFFATFKYNSNTQNVSFILILTWQEVLKNDLCSKKLIYFLYPLLRWKRIIFIFLELTAIPKSQHELSLSFKKLMRLFCPLQASHTAREHLDNLGFNNFLRKQPLKKPPLRRGLPNQNCKNRRRRRGCADPENFYFYLLHYKLRFLIFARGWEIWFWKRFV